MHEELNSLTFSKTLKHVNTLDVQMIITHVFTKNAVTVGLHPRFSQFLCPNFFKGEYFLKYSFNLHFY